MKAIVIGTRKNITIEPNIGYPGGYVGSDGHHYHDHELQLVVNDDPDYWARLEHQYAGMAMQTMLATLYNPKYHKELMASYTEVDAEEVARLSKCYAHALVEKLKEKEERK